MSNDNAPNADSVIVSAREASITQDLLNYLKRLVRLNAAPGWEQTAEEVEKAIGFFDAPSPSVGENASETVAPATEPTGPDGQPTNEAQIRAALSAFNRQGNGAAPEVTDREICEAFDQTVLGILLAEDLIQITDLATLTPEQAVRNLVDEYGKTYDEVAALREKLAASERERDEARADRDREAREFERRVFVEMLPRFYGDSSMGDAAIHAKEWAAAARAAMFPGEVKS